MNKLLGTLTSATLTFMLFAIPVRAEVSFKASYRESASRFQILDCVAQWWDHCQDAGEYRNEWVRRFGELNTQDLAFFEKYKKLRETYLVSINEPKDPLLRKDGFFSRGSAAEEDPIQFIFYSSLDQSEVFQKLETLISQTEIAWLKTFYEYFEPKTALLLGESKIPFEKWATELNTDLAHPGFDKFFDKIAGFYGITTSVNYEAIITWWPPISRTMATPTDKYLVFQKNPLMHMNESDIDIVFHEVVHTISSRQPKSQKQELTRRFLEICPVKDRLKRYAILEEPLAVALGQIAFLDEFQSENLHFEQSFYNNPWISAFGKMIYPVLKSELQNGRSISQGFIEKAANQCKELVRAAELLN